MHLTDHHDMIGTLIRYFPLTSFKAESCNILFCLKYTNAHYDVFN